MSGRGHQQGVVNGAAADKPAIVTGATSTFTLVVTAVCWLPIASYLLPHCHKSDSAARGLEMSSHLGDVPLRSSGTESHGIRWKEKEV